MSLNSERNDPATSNRRDRVFSIVAISAAGVVLALWAFYFFVQWHESSTGWSRILPGYADVEAGPLGPYQRSVPAAIAIFLGYVTFLLVLAVVVTYFRSAFENPALRRSIFSTAVVVGISWILFEGMITRGFQGDWYNIQTMMTHPGTVPVFGQRLLLLWPAMLLKHLRPSLSFIQSFLIIQALGLVLSVYLIGEWAALFVGRQLKFLGQILLAVFLLPTFEGYTAHDVGVVVIYTLCFILLYKRRYPLFGLVFAIGILNHPNILLLIPTAAASMWGREKRSTIAWVVSSTLAAYVAIRIFLNIVIPLPRSVDLTLWWNIRHFLPLSKDLLIGQFSVLPWYLAALAVFRHADPFLKACAVLLPMQYAIYFYFGQLNEARLFNGFIPILIGIFLCYFRQYFLNQSQPDKAME